LKSIFSESLKLISEFTALTTQGVYKVKAHAQGALHFVQFFFTEVEAAEFDIIDSLTPLGFLFFAESELSRLKEFTQLFTPVKLISYKNSPSKDET
jgi:hypothetical protein